MNKFDYIPCVVLSNPIVETEQPFMMTFGVNINGDTMEAAFIGEWARKLKNNLRPGDHGIIREATVHGNRIAFTFIHLEPEAKIGRNADLMA